MFYGYGWWAIFPLIGLVFMVLMMSRRFGLRRRASGSGMGMGSMRMMGDDHERHGKPDESALEVLGRRYAGGELTDEEFDAMRQKLEDQT